MPDSKTKSFKFVILKFHENKFGERLLKSHRDPVIYIIPQFKYQVKLMNNDNIHFYTYFSK